jgi:hypothetical protein
LQHGDALRRDVQPLLTEQGGGTVGHESSM